MSLATDRGGAHRIGVALAVVAAFGFSFKAILVKLAYPTLILLFGVVLHGRAITRREGLALALCYAGIAGVATVSRR